MPPPLDRATLDLDPSLLWVMHCADGPVPKPTAAAVAAFLRRETRPWELRWEEDFEAIPRQTREQAARLLGGRATDVTLTATTSSALVTVAQGFPWRDGDEVVAPLGEFPANSWCWKALAARGVGLREVSLWEGHRAGAEAWESTPPTADAAPEDRLLAALGPRSRILAASWVRFQDGLKLDLPRLAAGCAERGVALVVDGIQGAGTHRPALTGVAAFTAGGHKGLLAPQGLALLWTDPAFRARLLPAGTWLSVEEATDFRRPSTDLDRRWVDDGRRLEPGVPNLVGAVALRRSLQLLNDAGVEEIEAHVRRLQERLLSALRDFPAWRYEAARNLRLLAAHRLGPFVALHHGGRGREALEATLAAGRSRGIYASVREGYLRIALHGWHEEAEVERLAAWLTTA